MAVLLLLCLFSMPYGYYTIVRIAAMIVFSYLAYLYFKDENVLLGITFAALAVVFQPIVKMGMSKASWNVIDVIVAIGLLVLIFVKPKHYE